MNQSSVTKQPGKRAVDWRAAFAGGRDVSRGLELANSGPLVQPGHFGGKVRLENKIGSWMRLTKTQLKSVMLINFSEVKRLAGFDPLDERKRFHL